jgi:hypothetical protein
MSFTGTLSSGGLFSTDVTTLIGEGLAFVGRLALQMWERRLQGLYDVLDQRRTITLEDATGRMATVETVQRVRFCQNHVTALTEYAWGEGELFADYRCTPGVPVDRYAEGSRQVMLISLREHKNAGDELCLRSHRRILNGFVRSEEYWESDVCHRTQCIEVRIIFPTERKCQRATVTVRSTGKTVALGPDCYHTLPDGRLALCWTNTRPRFNERYLLRWVW